MGIFCELHLADVGKLGGNMMKDVIKYFTREPLAKSQKN